MSPARGRQTRPSHLHLSAAWLPDALNRVLAGVGVGDQVSVPAALVALAAWAAVPALLGLLAIQRRDVV